MIQRQCLLYWTVIRTGPAVLSVLRMVFEPKFPAGNFKFQHYTWTDRKMDNFTAAALWFVYVLPEFMSTLEILRFQFFPSLAQKNSNTKKKMATRESIKSGINCFTFSAQNSLHWPTRDCFRCHHLRLSKFGISPTMWQNRPYTGQPKTTKKRWNRTSSNASVCMSSV